MNDDDDRHDEVVWDFAAAWFSKPNNPGVPWDPVPAPFARALRPSFVRQAGWGQLLIQAQGKIWRLSVYCMPLQSTRVFSKKWAFKCNIFLFFVDELAISSSNSNPFSCPSLSWNFVRKGGYKLWGVLFVWWKNGGSFFLNSGNFFLLTLLVFRFSLLNQVDVNIFLNIWTITSLKIWIVNCVSVDAQKMFFSVFFWLRLKSKLPCSRGLSVA